MEKSGSSKDSEVPESGGQSGIDGHIDETNNHIWKHVLKVIQVVSMEKKNIDLFISNVLYCWECLNSALIIKLKQYELKPLSCVGNIFSRSFRCFLKIENKLKQQLNLCIDESTGNITMIRLLKHHETSLVIL